MTKFTAIAWTISLLASMATTSSARAFPCAEKDDFRSFATAGIEPGFAVRDRAPNYLILPQLNAGVGFGCYSPYWGAFRPLALLLLPSIGGAYSLDSYGSSDAEKHTLWQFSPALVGPAYYFRHGDEPAPRVPLALLVGPQWTYRSFFSDFVRGGWILMFALPVQYDIPLPKF